MKKFKIAFVCCVMIVLGRLPGRCADKTLVSWVSLANTSQQGGSALTIQSGDEFDAIVFGERAAGRWMAGSEFFRRTQPEQSGNAAETAKPDELVQMAIVYESDEIRLYRNGQAYVAYKAKNIDLLKPEHHIAVFGLRHVGAGTGSFLAGTVDDARIYDRALTLQEIQSLKPNEASDIKPLAWWDFEGETVKDRAGHFGYHKPEGGVKIKDGRLLLDGKGYLVAARSEKDLKLASGGAVPSVPTGPYVPETPEWPDQPPANWMTFHLAHPGPGNAMPGDPNCIFDYKGKVHLHYIYRNAWGFVFGHVSSDDMVHWKWHKTVLAPPTTGHGMFSGTGFYTKEGRPAIIYHGQGKGRNVVHYPADDNFDSWTEPEVVLPKNADGSVPNIRHWDPDCWLMNDTYYAYSGGKNPQLMKSPDLKNWTYLGDLLHPDYPSNLGIPKDEDISCGNMFKMGNRWMLLCISHPKGARYYLGDFKDEKYLPSFHAMMSFGSNQFFAPESVLTHDGRRVMWAWLLNMPIAPTGVQSLPRELELPADGVLRIKPLRELQSLRSDEKQENEIQVKSDTAYRLKEIRGDALEMELVFKAPTAKEFGLDVLCDKNGENGLRVTCKPEGKTLKVGKAEAPFELKQGEDLVLRVFIDRNLVEVFANDRQAIVAADKFIPDNTDVALFSKGGEVLVKSVKGWKMKSIYPAGPRGEKAQASEVPVKCTPSADGTITYEPADGAGKGKHIALVCGEWEYRCEESLPMLAKILAKRHGFKCTVLFQVNPKDGTVDPSVRNNIPGMSVLKSADMMIVFAMDLTLPDEQMKPFVEFLETGKPVFGIRCTLLSFKYPKDSPYARFDVGNGGYARDLFGESWKGHYGSHGKESTRGLRAGVSEAHPILRGVNDVWGPTDVYRVTKLPEDATVLMYGQVLTGMQPEDKPNLQKSVMPMVWIREIKRESGKVSRVVMSTIGAAQDMESEDLRRLYVNSVYWALGLESGIPQKADVAYVGVDWKASPFGGGKFRGGLKPADFAVKE